MSEISAFFERLPLVTRNLFISTIVVSTSCVFIPSLSGHVILEWGKVFYDWQIWRPFTAFFFANMRTFNGLMEIYSLYNFSRGVEKQKFNGNAVDYSFYLFIVMPLIVVWSFILDMYTHLPALVGALMYTWSRANRYGMVNVNFIQIPAGYLPLATLAFDFLLTGQTQFFVRLGGMAIAYFYQCLESRTLGPVYKFICDSLGLDQQRTNPLNRVGTVHTVESLDGYLSAPKWFQKLAGTVPTRATGQQKGKVNTLNSTGTTKTSTGFSTGFGSSFKGTGHRLGN